MVSIDGFVALLIGRIIVGLGIGLASMTVPLYIAEVSPAAHRGAMVTMNVLFITGGQFVAYLVAAGFAEVPNGWRYMLGLSGAPAVVQFIGMCFLPESPRYLLSKGKSQEAYKVLERMNIPNIDEEMEDLTLSVSSAAVARASWRDLFDPSIRRALIIGVSLQAFQQLCGCVALFAPFCLLFLFTFPPLASTLQCTTRRPF